MALKNFYFIILHSKRCFHMYIANTQKKHYLVETKTNFKQDRFLYASQGIHFNYNFLMFPFHLFQSILLLLKMGSTKKIRWFPCYTLCLCCEMFCRYGIVLVNCRGNGVYQIRGSPVIEVQSFQCVKLHLKLTHFFHCTTSVPIHVLINSALLGAIKTAIFLSFSNPYKCSLSIWGSDTTLLFCFRLHTGI